MVGQSEDRGHNRTTFMIPRLHIKVSLDLEVDRFGSDVLKVELVFMTSTT